MPLVVPGITQKEGTTTAAGASSSNGKDNTNGAWMNKLMGKKLTDGATDENVRGSHPDSQLSTKMESTQ